MSLTKIKRANQMTEQIHYHLSNLSLFQACDSVFIRELARNGHLLCMQKGQLIFGRGESANRFFACLSGTIKLFRETSGGVQAVVDIIHAGQILGESSIFHTHIYPVSAECIEKTDLISLPLALLEDRMRQDTALAFAVMRMMANQQRQQDHEIENRTLKNAPQRIACFLLGLIDRNKTGRITIDLPYEKSVIAARLGMQPETFSRALQTLKRDLNLDIAGTRITIKDIQNMAAYTCNACSSEFPCA